MILSISIDEKSKCYEKINFLMIDKGKTDIIKKLKSYEDMYSGLIEEEILWKAFFTRCKKMITRNI